MDMEEKNQELSMLMTTVVPIAAVALIGLLLYSFLPFWLFIVVTAILAIVALVPKLRNGVINALKPPADAEDTKSTQQPDK